MPNIQPGALDHRITIQRSTPASNNNFNEPIDSWANTATIWASRHNTSAGESYRAQEVGAEITTRFTVHHSSVTANTTPKDRIVFQGDIGALPCPATPRLTVPRHAQPHAGVRDIQGTGTALHATSLGC